MLFDMPYQRFHSSHELLLRQLVHKSDRNMDNLGAASQGWRIVVFRAVERFLSQRVRCHQCLSELHEWKRRTVRI